MGRLTSWSAYDSVGAPVEDTAGIWKVTYERERLRVGERETIRYFGADGTPVFWDGEAGAILVRDEVGNVTSSTTIDVDGRPSHGPSGIARIEHAYDESGNLHERRYFDMAGMPTADSSGIGIFVMTYDRRGNPRETRFYSPNGQPTLIASDDKGGYAGVRYELDRVGQVNVEHYFGVDGAPILTTLGYATQADIIDSGGRLVERRFLGADGRPTLHRDGYAAFRNEFNPAGQRTSIIRLGVDGAPTYDKDVADSRS